MTINFSIGEFVVRNRAYVEEILPGFNCGCTKQTLGSLGYIGANPSEVMATGNVFTGGTIKSFVRVKLNIVTNPAFRTANNGIVIYFCSDEHLNNSLELSTAYLDDKCFVKAKNVSGGVISKGQLVRQVGFDGTEQLPTIDLASAAASSTCAVMGICVNDVNDTECASILISGSYNGLDTSGFGAVGDLVFLSNTPGEIAVSAGTEEKLIGRVLVISTDGSISLVPSLGGSGGGGGGFFTDGSGLNAGVGKGTTSPTATAENAIAQGDGSDATGINSFAFGANNTASGLDSFAHGDGNTASSQATFAQGTDNTVSASYSMAQGVGNNVTVRYSLAQGYYNDISGFHSMAQGAVNDITTAGAYSFAQGSNHYIDGQYNLAQGFDQDVSGYMCFAQGYSNTVAGGSGHFQHGYINYINGTNTFYNNQFGSNNTIGNDNYNVTQFGFSHFTYNDNDYVFQFGEDHNTGSYNDHIFQFGNSHNIGSYLDYITQIGDDHNLGSNIYHITQIGYSHNGSGNYAYPSNHVLQLGDNNNFGNATNHLMQFGVSHNTGFQNSHSLQFGDDHTFGSYNTHIVSFGYGHDVGSNNDHIFAGGSLITVENTVEYSFVHGYDNTINGEQVFVQGRGSSWAGGGLENCFVQGYNNDFTGTFAAYQILAQGRDNSIGGESNNILVQGYGNTVSSSTNNAALQGLNNTISSNNASAFGSNNTVNMNSENSFAIGYGNTISGPQSLALGYNNTADSNSFALGRNCGADDYNTVAIGNNSDTYSLNCFAFGSYCRAGYGDLPNNVAFGGYYVQSDGYNSQAFGYNSQVTGYYSTILGGFLSSASADNTLVHGKTAGASITGQRAFSAQIASGSGAPANSQWNFIAHELTVIAAAPSGTISIPLVDGRAYSFQVNIVANDLGVGSPTNRASYVNTQFLAYQNGGTATLIGGPTLTAITDGADIALFTTSISTSGIDLTITFTRNAATLPYTFAYWISFIETD